MYAIRSYYDRHREGMHRLRAVPGTLPRRLHHHGAAARNREELEMALSRHRAEGSGMIAGLFRFT